MAKMAKGRGWAYIGTGLGGLVSVAANVAHSFIHPNPEPGAVVSAIVWPVFLFIAIEILARTAWPTGWSWNLLKWIGLPPVALVAAFVSYRHLSGLLDYYGEEDLVVWFGPLAVDGLMLMATSALIATGDRHTETADPTLELETAQAESGDTTTVTPEPDPIPVPAEPSAVTLEIPAHLLGPARFAAVSHEQSTGRPITADDLAVRLNIESVTAQAVLDRLNTPATINGAIVGGTR